jgi:tRNA (guanosine-2'-O-)-methyltransferase
MRKKWGRWRGYMDELEEVMRVCAEHLAESEALMAEVWERKLWRGARTTSIDGEILRRALDMPFFRELIEIAWRIGPDAELEPADFEGRPWNEGEAETRVLSSERVPEVQALAPDEREPGAEPPARLRAAERALAERSRSLVVVLDDLVNARNLSAVVRTAESLGLQEVHMIQREGRVALERTVTMRAQRWLDLFWYERAATAIEALRARGYRILVSDYSEDARPVDQVPLTDKVALCFGSEQVGVSDALREAADGCFYLPSVGFTSYINVSVAAGISIHTIDARQRSEGLRTPIDETDRAALRKSWYAALARGDESRARRYLAWLDDPPIPGDDLRASRPMGKDGQL